MEKKFQRELESLDEIFDFTSEFISKNIIEESTAFSINLAIEEIFTNMIKYNSDSFNDISISLKREGNDLIICMTDFGVDSFDLTKSEAVDINQSLPERKVGGLGLHLVRSMMDKISYEYKNRNSKVTLIKHLEK